MRQPRASERVIRRRAPGALEAAILGGLIAAAAPASAASTRPVDVRAQQQWLANVAPLLAQPPQIAWGQKSPRVPAPPRSFLRAAGDLTSFAAIAPALKRKGWIRAVEVPTARGPVVMDCLIVFHRTKDRAFDGRRVVLCHNAVEGKRNNRTEPLFFGPGYYTSVSPNETTYGGRIHAYAVPVSALAAQLDALAERGSVFRCPYSKQMGALPADSPVVFRDQRATKHLVFRATRDAQVNACMQSLLGRYYLGTYTNGTLPDLFRR